MSGTVIEAARGGSPEALASLYREHGAALFRLAYRLTGTREEAEDVVHDVFVGLPEALARYEERGNLRSWLKRVTARVALMRLRASRRRREVALDGVTPSPTKADSDFDDERLHAALNALPDKLRSVVVLKETEGYSHGEVADLLGISVIASRVRLARALKQLRDALEDGR
jgi:RNA polymerase sigma-70 factor, ECF subfamily